MSFGSIKKPNASLYTDIGRVVQESLPFLNKNEDESLASLLNFEELLENSNLNQIGALSEAAAKKINRAATYNGLLDRNTITSLDYPLVELSKDELRALKYSNRIRALQNQEDLKKFKESLHEILAVSSFSVSFDIEEEKEVHEGLALLFGSQYSIGRITAKQYAELLELEAQIAKETGEKSKSGSRKARREARSTAERTGFVSEAIEIYEEEITDLDDQNIGNPAIGYSLLMGSVITAEESNNAAIDTLSAVDENNSYIDTILRRDRSSQVEIGTVSNLRAYSLTEIFDNCYDCFFEGIKGSINADFAIEFRIKEFLDNFVSLMKRLKFAFDIEAMIKANLCSLARLGKLCPIEIAFLIASLIGLLRFIITEIIFNFKGFLLSLFSAILLPLFSLLEISGRLILSPFDIYFGCTAKSLRNKIDYIEGQFGYSIGKIAEIIQRGNLDEHPELERRVRKMSPEEITRIVTGGLGVVLEGGTFSSESITTIVANAISKIKTDNIPVLNMMTSEVGDILDPLEMIKSLLVESNGKLSDAIREIIDGLYALKEELLAGAISRTELAAKIIAISTFISVLIAIMRAIFGNVSLCKDEIDGNGRNVSVPTIETREMLQLVGLSPNLILQVFDNNTEPSDFVNNIGDRIIDPVSPPRDRILNRTTGSTFTLRRCSNRETLLLSDTELNELITGLGVA